MFGDVAFPQSEEYDEFRYKFLIVLMLCGALSGVFILLGSAAGWFVTALTIVWLLVSNQVMPVAYSSNAMATFIVSMLNLGVFFHVYGARSMSYFVRMRDDNTELERLASHDMLTGVLNAWAYYAACAQNIRAASRSGEPYAVLFVDLDHFKAVNDTHGHSAGDAVLKAVARCMHQSIRNSDVLGRIGGEEFSIFMPNTARPGALQLAAALRGAVEDLEPSIGDRRLRITVRIGVAVCDEAAEEMQAIQQRADQAMYLAKKLGRNRVSVFGESTAVGVLH